MSNVDIARSAYEAFSRGDLETLKEMLAEDSTWLTSDELPLGGESRGREEVIGNFAQIPNYWTSFSFEPEEFIDGGDWVAEKVVVLQPWDAGTDSGHTFTAADLRTSPPEPIQVIGTGPLVVGASVPPVGTFTFRRIS